MKKKNVTKGALLASILAMVLCVTMLVGTTFAWFTDTASAKVNKIQSGKLDVVLEMLTKDKEETEATWKDAEGKTLDFVKAKNAPENEAILWEPGCTYNLPDLRIRNNGNLVLKYKIVISGATGDTKLLDAIQFAATVDGTAAEFGNGKTIVTDKVLAPNAENTLKISGTMLTSAGNEYQNLTVSGIAITVLATQKDAEFDSTRNDYDKDAEYPVVAKDQNTLNDAIVNPAGGGNKVSVALPTGTSFTLDNGVAHEGDKSRDVTFTGDGSQTIDVITNATGAEGGQLNYQRGSTFTFENLTIQAGEGNYDGIVCDELVYKNCTIKGKLTLYGKATFINCTFENDMANQYSIWTWGGTDVTFEGCTFNTNGKAILLYGQATEAKPTNLVVNNCTFNDRNNGSAGKAAIEIGNDYNATYTLTVNNATVNGFADGKNTGSKLWANKNSMDAAHLTVTIDGAKVQ